MKSTPRWIRNRMSFAGTAGSGLKSAAVETMRPDLRVGERLEDGLHVAHRTPDVHRVSAAVGVAHHEVAAGAGVTLLVAPALHRLVDGGLIEILVRPRDGRQDDVPARLVRRLHRAQGLRDQCRVRIGALPVLRQRLRWLPVARRGGAGASPVSGRLARRRRCCMRPPTSAEHSDDADDLAPLHVRSSPWSMASPCSDRRDSDR